MSKTTFTPGPWGVDSDGSISAENGMTNVAGAYSDGCGIGWRNDADAVLAAAAPELLEALQDLIKAYEIHDGAIHALAIKFAVSAINKARGQN
jgi:hypothetical protein